MTLTPFSTCVFWPFGVPRADSERCRPPWLPPTSGDSTTTPGALYSMTFQMSRPPGVVSRILLSMFTFEPTERVSTTGDSALTVTASASAPTVIGISTVTLSPWRTTTPSRITVLNPSSAIFTL